MTPLSILYVDDDPDIRTIVGIALSMDAGLSVRIVGSAGEALAALAGGAAPDVIVLDVMMPEMDGLTLLARLRADPARRAIPAIFMTARARPADLARYRGQGVIGVIRKPFDPIALSREIRALVDAALPGDDDSQGFDPSA